MKVASIRFVVSFVALFVCSSPAAMLYVDLNSTNPVSPYANWSTAATNIQDAIDVSSNGDVVLVTNGIYAVGGKSMDGVITNRISVNKAVTVQSVNGPVATVIQGAGMTNGFSAIRCAWLTNNAALIGFTLQWGATRNSSDDSANGGGVWCCSSNVIVANCLIQSNSAARSGGGAYQGTLINCFIGGNNAMGKGGGFYLANLSSCTIVSNSARPSPPTITGALTNCIFYYNSGDIFSDSTFSYCCTTPLPPGPGNFTNPPQLFADGMHLTSTSPCIGAGTNLTTGSDLFRQTWSNPPSIGCAEWQPAPMTMQPQIELTSVPVGFMVGPVAVNGQPPFSFQWLKDGTPVQDDGHLSGSQTTNLIGASIGFSDVGSYQLVVSNAFGVVTSAVAQLAIHCVNAAGSSPQPPYTNWATAATNIQDAIDVSKNGDLILVTNGVYAVGGKSMDGVITNRVSLDKAITVQSVNGPFATVIQGAGMTNGISAIRCAWLTNNAALIGFTLQWGGTRKSSDNSGNGGGVWCASSNAVVANCLILSNTAFSSGGAIYRGTFDDCLISGNTGTPLGDAAITGALLSSCTVVSNVDFIAAVDLASLTNCIVYYNTGGSSMSTFSYCCTTPLPAGPGNFTNPPQLFADGMHLTSTSPCIGAGTNLTIGSDLFGQIWANPPSVGCAEWQPAPMTTQSQVELTSLPGGFMVGLVAVNGQPPFSFQWFKDSMPVQDDGRLSGSQTTNLIATSIKFSDAGSYQLVVSNAFGVVTSAVAQLVIHCVNVAGSNPQPPYTNWATAATSIQDAIDTAAAGEIVLVTNGIYATGGRVVSSSSTNRVVLDKAVTVVSVNGYSATRIQGAWDPISTNGPDAIRCAWLTNGAVLSGFTLKDGATGSSNLIGDVSDSGGGVWCASTNAVVSNCELTNNSAIYGAGVCSGTVNNCFIVGNTAFQYGGGALYSTLNNCTVVGNYCSRYYNMFHGNGAGGYDCAAYNSIFLGNYSLDQGSHLYNDSDNYGNDISHQPPSATFAFCDTDPLLANTGDIDADPQFLDSFHIETISPCRSAGSALYATGTDLDGEAWANPPSMGCDEVVISNLVGPLSVNIQIPAYQTNVLVNRSAAFWGSISGRAAYVTWSFGDGPIFTNFGTGSIHQWTNSGNYTITFTAYNNDNTGGVSADTNFPVLALAVPQLQSLTLGTNGFQFQFPGQWSANYTIEYATNLAPPVTWQTLQTIYFNYQNLIQVSDSASTNTARFYRVLVQ